MKVLQEYWASTVIFIGIFSQCTPIFLYIHSILSFWSSTSSVTTSDVNVVLMGPMKERMDTHEGKKIKYTFVMCLTTRTAGSESVCTNRENPAVWSFRSSQVVDELREHPRLCVRVSSLTTRWLDVYVPHVSFSRGHAVAPHTVPDGLRDEFLPTAAYNFPHSSTSVSFYPLYTDFAETDASRNMCQR